MEMADGARTPSSALIRSFLTGTSMDRRLPVWSTLSWSAIGAARLARLTGSSAPAGGFLCSVAPLNITSVTVYRPGRLYTCVGDWPEPVVPSPNSQRYVITGCALTVPSAEKLTGRPSDWGFGPKVKPGVIPL